MSARRTTVVHHQKQTDDDEEDCQPARSHLPQYFVLPLRPPALAVVKEVEAEVEVEVVARPSQPSTQQPAVSLGPAPIRVQFIPRSRRQTPTVAEIQEQARIDEEIADVERLETEKTWALAQFSAVLDLQKKRAQSHEIGASANRPTTMDDQDILTAEDFCEWRQRELARLALL